MTVRVTTTITTTTSGHSWAHDYEDDHAHKLAHNEGGTILVGSVVAQSAPSQSVWYDVQPYTGTHWCQSAASKVTRPFDVGILPSHGEFPSDSEARA